MPVSGAGSEITALYESLQAYACAARQHKGKDLESIFELKSTNTRAADCDSAAARHVPGCGRVRAS